MITAALTGSSLKTPGITGALGVHDIAVGGHTPGQQLATAQFGLPATPHPIGDQGALILGHGPPDLEHELIMWVLTHGSLQKLDLTAPLGQFIDQKHVMDIVAGQPIRSRHHDQFKGGQRGTIPQPIQARPIELGPAIAVIPIDVLFRQMPVGMRRHMGLQAVELLLNGLRLLLTIGRDTDIQGHFHGTPPAGVMAQATCLRRVPSPMAEGTGRPHPSVDRHRSVRSPYGVYAKSVFMGSSCVIVIYPTQEDTLTNGLSAAAAEAGATRRVGSTPHRVQQNLSFEIIPLKRFIRTVRGTWASTSTACGVPKPLGNIGVWSSWPIRCCT